MPPDDEPKTQTIQLKEGKISRLYVVMCNLCHGTFTNQVPALEIMTRDLILAGWKAIDGCWYCPDCRGAK